MFFDLNGPHYTEKPELFRDVLRSDRSGLVAFEDGYTLLRRGAPPGAIAEVVALADRRVEAELLDRRTGQNVADHRVASRFTRMGRHTADRSGMLLHQFVRPLGPGRYSAVYRVRFGAAPDGPYNVGSLEVRDVERRRLVAERTLTPSDVETGADYRSISVPFELQERATVEVRMRFASEIDVWIDHVELRDQSPEPSASRQTEGSFQRAVTTPSADR